MSEIVPKWDKISAKLYKSGLRTKLIHSSISAKGWKPCLECSKLLLLTKNGKSVHTLPNSDHSASTQEPRGTNAVPTPVRCPAQKPSYTQIRLDSIYCPAECQLFPILGWLGSPFQGSQMQDSVIWVKDNHRQKRSRDGHTANPLSGPWAPTPQPPFWAAWELSSRFDAGDFCARNISEQSKYQT